MCDATITTAWEATFIDVGTITVDLDGTGSEPRRDCGDAQRGGTGLAMRSGEVRAWRCARSRTAARRRSLHAHCLDTHRPRASGLELAGTLEPGSCRT